MTRFLVHVLSEMSLLLIQHKTILLSVSLVEYLWCLNNARFTTSPVCVLRTAATSSARGCVIPSGRSLVQANISSQEKPPPFKGNLTYIAAQAKTLLASPVSIVLISKLAALAGTTVRLNLILLISFIIST